MKKIMIVLLIFVCRGLSAMDYSLQFPSEDIFQQRLIGKIPAHVIKQLKLTETFANQTMTPCTIVITLDGCLKTYVDKLTTPDHKAKARHHLDAKRKNYITAVLKAADILNTNDNQ